MNRSLIKSRLYDESLSPYEVFRRLGKIFPLVHVHHFLGRYRVGQRIRLFRKLGVPEVIVQHEQSIREQTLQVTVFDREPLTQVLDLTVYPRSIRAYHEAGTEHFVHRVSAALGYDDVFEEDEDSGFDERESPEEKRYWAKLRKCRDTMTALRDTFEGAEALFTTGSNTYRVRVHDLKVTEPRFYAAVEPLPTRGLPNFPRPYHPCWWWDEFDCGPHFWVRGPVICEIFKFGEGVPVAVRYGESLANPEPSRNNRLEIARAIQAHEQAALTPYLQGSLDLFWNKTWIGLVSEHQSDDFPRMSARVQLAADLSTELREMLTRWSAQEEEKSLGEEGEEGEQLCKDELYEGWWLRAPDGTILELNSVPTVDLRKQTIEWWYCRRTRRDT
jgi:hypothetical protein